MEGTQNQIQQQGHHFETVGATLQRSLTVQQVQILQMQNDSANTTQLVELQGKLQKQLHTEVKVIEKNMTILKDNVDKLYLKEEVVQLCDTHNTREQSTKALEDMFRNEMEKMRNNEKGKHDQILCVVTTTFITTYKGGMEEPCEEKGIEWV